MLRGQFREVLACRVLAVIGLISLSACVLTSVVTTKVDLSSIAPDIGHEAVRTEIEKFVSNQEVRCTHNEFSGVCRFWSGENALGTAINYSYRTKSNEKYVFVRTEFGSFLPISDEEFEDGSAVPELHLMAEQWLNSTWGNPYDLPVIRSVSGRDVEVEVR